MRVLVPLVLLLPLTLVVPAPPASACHVSPIDVKPISVAGHYVVLGIDYGGCPHELTLCTQVWRESNGQRGLQTSGSNPDSLVVLVCPYP